jgi:glycosyltransferase involved in cell wall biosynthesis
LFALAGEIPVSGDGDHLWRILRPHLECRSLRARRFALASFHEGWNMKTGANSLPVLRPLRILMVVDNGYPAMGGAELQVRTLCRKLGARGHAVDVVCYPRDTPVPSRDVVDGTAVTRIGYPRIRLLGALVLYLRFGLFLLRHRNSYDAIHVHTAENMAAVVGLAKPLLRAFAMAKISGAAEFDNGWLDPAARQRPVNRLRHAMFRRLDAVQAVSSFAVERLTAAGYPAQAIHLIPNAVDTERFCPVAQGERMHNDTVRVIYVGRLEAVKGVDVLLHAWSLLRRRCDARLLIVGKGSQLEELQTLARALGVWREVHFVGDVADPAVWLRQADVYVQPSRQEGLANAVLEAMASALPVVATRVSGSLDLIEEGANGYLVTPDDAAALASALEKVLGANPEQRRCMGELSRQVVQARFGVLGVVQSLERVYGSTAVPPCAHEQVAQGWQGKA